MEEGLDEFSIYGFSVNYPKECRVEFNPKGRREAGDVVFHFPNRNKIFFTWGELEKATKRFQTVEEHAGNSLETVRKTGSVKKFERVTSDTLTVRSHKAVYNHVRLDEVTVGFFAGKRSSPRDACSVHVHCPNSSRYFVVYTLFPREFVEEQEKAVRAMTDSLKCH
jgi:hypothetical protein